MKKKITTIGSGTGSFMLLSGLVKHDLNISAIVSMADDGGSTGVLRDELGVLPPGDVRQCLTALSPAGNELRKLMNFRYGEGSLKGHTFGNIFLSTLEKTTGSFAEGLEVAQNILNVSGEVLPVTTQDARLVMRLNDQTVLLGEEMIERTAFQQVGPEKMYYDPIISANPKAIDRILSSDAVIIGPGTFYSGILANLAIPEISRALKETKAKIIFPVNLTNKKGHTSHFSIEDYVDELERFIGEGRADYVLVNKKNPASELLERYRNMEGEDALVRIEKTEDEKNRFGENKFVLRDLIDGNLVNLENKNDSIAHTRSFIRHDSDKLTKTILDLL
jgi:uncharacterized cofD-like protein